MFENLLGKENKHMQKNYGYIPLYLNKIIERALNDGEDFSADTSHSITLNDEEKNVIHRSIHSVKGILLIWDKDSKIVLSHTSSGSTTTTDGLELSPFKLFFQSELAGQSLEIVRTGGASISLTIYDINTIQGSFKVL